ncbi:MAG TPA: cytochrome c [Bryobacteraceae bacterium]|jgi:mono/diheme cytochrome c family protein|nr:cytochrome c [Bryobacteraceae bacterium]
MRLVALLTLASALVAQTPSALNGKKLFDSYGCYQCHDHDGHGGAGARLAPNPLPFAAFSKYVRQPTGEMPPYTKKVVSDRELADIYAYLQSIPQPPAAKSIPILNH